MSSDQPYNELGQILSQGGEIALGLSIAYGWTDSQIAMLFARRFEPMSPDDRQRLMEIAQGAVDSAERINNLPDDGWIGPDDIITNEFLFGENPGGRRARFVGRVDFTGNGDWRDIWLDAADFGGKSGLFDAIREKGIEYAKKYPEKFKVPAGQDIPDPRVQILVSEKRF